MGREIFLRDGGELLVVLGAEGGDAVLHIGGDLGADFEAEDQFDGEEGGEGDEEATEAAADVCYGDLGC